MSRNQSASRRASRRSTAQQTQHAALGLTDDHADIVRSDSQDSIGQETTAAAAAQHPSPAAPALSHHVDIQSSHSLPQRQQQQHEAMLTSHLNSSYSALPLYSSAISPTFSYPRDDAQLPYGGSGPLGPPVVESALRSRGHHGTDGASSSSGQSEDEEGSHLLSASSSDRASDRLSALHVPSSLYSGSARQVQSFYNNQNAFIDSLKKLIIFNATAETDEKPSTAAFLAIQISLALTFVLLGLKLFTAIYSGSIAVIASAVDSMLDVVSQGTLLITSHIMKRYDPYNYPAGKNRMEPTAVLVFSCIMGMAALFLLYESINDLITGLQDDGKRVKMDAVTVSILAFVVGVQLLMWLYCRRVAALKVPGASSAAALAQDHINDVFINIIGGVPAIIAGYVQSAWMADPIGGICLSLYIAVRWLLTGIEQVPSMVGKTAEPSFLNQLTFLAGTHDPRILKVDTILAYHVGIKYQCEVHIVLPENLSLREGHDIGESLEQKIERLDEVEMAFVHLDYEYTHAPEHAARAKAAGKDFRRGVEAATAAPAALPSAASAADDNISPVSRASSADLAQSTVVELAGMS